MELIKLLNGMKNIKKNSIEKMKNLKYPHEK